MFKKSERLTRSEFEQYFKNGKRHHFPTMTVVHTKKDKLHVSVVVGKKVQKKAHDRNTIRRRVYGKLYTLLKKQHTGVFVVLIKPSFSHLTKKQQLEEVQKNLNRITMSPIS